MLPKRDEVYSLAQHNQQLHLAQTTASDCQRTEESLLLRSRLLFSSRLAATVLLIETRPTCGYSTAMSITLQCEAPTFGEDYAPHTGHAPVIAKVVGGNRTRVIGWVSFPLHPSVQYQLSRADRGSRPRFCRLNYYDASRRRDSDPRMQFCRLPPVPLGYADIMGQSGLEPPDLRRGAYVTARLAYVGLAKMPIRPVDTPERTRTSTPLRTQALETCASPNSATGAYSRIRKVGVEPTRDFSQRILSP